VHVNIDVGNTHQADAYLAQQLAVMQYTQYMQYMQLLALSPYAGLAAARAARGTAPRSAPPPAFQSTLTNPDNPWGFNFPPTPLTK
jgi:hypothetical protein